MYSLVVGYDGARNLRDEERSVWQRKPEREQKEETKQSRWGFRGMTVRNVVGAIDSSVGAGRNRVLVHHAAGSAPAAA